MIEALIIDNVRSAHNVGVLMRTCDGLGVKTVITLGISPHMRCSDDSRLPHVIQKAERAISKTALGAESSLRLIHYKNVKDLHTFIQTSQLQLICLEQTKNSTDLRSTKATSKSALVVGNELDGVSESLLRVADKVTHISMKGKKKSLNVATACSAALYWLT